MMNNRPHKRLLSWQKSIELSKDIYTLTKDFPNEEKFGLVIQMRKAVISIPSNIAEGMARQSIKEKIQFLSVALGSTSELDTQIEISHKLGYITLKQKEQIISYLDEVSRLLNGLMGSFRKRVKNEKDF